MGEKMEWMGWWDYSFTGLVLSRGKNNERDGCIPLLIPVLSWLSTWFDFTRCRDSSRSARFTTASSEIVWAVHTPLWSVHHWVKRTIDKDGIFLSRVLDLLPDFLPSKWKNRESVILDGQKACLKVFEPVSCVSWAQEWPSQHASDFSCSFALLLSIICWVPNFLVSVSSIRSDCVFSNFFEWLLFCATCTVLFGVNSNAKTCVPVGKSIVGESTLSKQQ